MGLDQKGKLAGHNAVVIAGIDAIDLAECVESHGQRYQWRPRLTVFWANQESTSTIPAALD